MSAEGIRLTATDQTIEINYNTDFSKINPDDYQRFVINPPSGHNNIALSQREMYCLLYYLSGHSLSKIAKKFHVSPQTVRTYIDRVKIKFNCYSKIELISIAYEVNLQKLANYTTL